MKIVVAGGGTGGHIIPNIALIDKLKELRPEVEILYVGAKGGMEEGLIKERSWAFKGINCGKLRRYFSWENFSDVFKQLAGIGQSLMIVRKFKPEVIFCKGGYVSFPVAVAGGMMRIPVIIHESDAMPGLANKLAANFARVICVSFEETKKLWLKKKLVVTGNPVRAELKEGSKKKGWKLSDFKVGKPVIMVMGGSQGAQFINELIELNLEKLVKHYQIIHICGKGKINEKFAGKYSGYKCFEFVGEELKDLLAITDLMISRAGANSLAEIEFLAKPAILIPLVVGSRGDQIKNAELFSKDHAAVVIDERKEKAEKIDIMGLIEKLLKVKHGTLKGNDAAQKIAELILSYEHK